MLWLMTRKKKGKNGVPYDSTYNILLHNKYTQYIMENEIFKNNILVIPLYMGIIIIGMISDRCENRIDVIIYIILLWLRVRREFSARWYNIIIFMIFT